MRSDWRRLDSVSRHRDSSTPNRARAAVADVCNRSVRETDVVGRFGGEEFIILLPHTRATDAKIVAERIRKTMLETEIYWEGQRLDIRLSLGVAEAGLHADDYDELITAADEALYAAKEGGRNQTVIAEIAIDDTGVFRLHVRAA